MISSLKRLERGCAWDNGFALGLCELGKSDAQHVHLDAGGDERDDGMHVLRDAGRRVQRYAVQTVSMSRSAMPWLRRKSRATLAPSTSKRLSALAYCGVRPMSWNMAPA